MDVFRKFVDLKEIIYIIVYYIELDYSGVLFKVFEENGYRVQVIGIQFVRNFFQGFYGDKVVENFKVVKDGEEMQIGGKIF